MKEYFKWVIKDKKHNYKLILALIGIVISIIVTPILITSYNEGAALSMVILAFIAIYGFTVGMLLEPYTIYKRLKRIKKLK